MDEKEFLSKLAELKDTGALQGGFVTLEQIKEVFPQLDEEKLAFLTDYLKKVNIGVDEPLDTTQYLSSEENGYLHFYMEELKEMDAISNDMKRVLVMAVLNGDHTAKEKLIKAYLQNVVDIAKLYAGQGVSIADLIGEGNVALALAVDMLDCVESPEDADPLIVKMIMNGMEEFIGVESSAEKTGEKALNLVEKVSENAKKLSEELLRKVTVEELALESRISAKKIKEAMLISEECQEYIEAVTKEV